MERPWFVSILLIFLLTSTAWVQAQAPAGMPVPIVAPATAFVHVAVIPMDRERVLRDQTVVVQGGRIVALGSARQVPVPAGAVRVDGRGKYLIPGLADMHAHMPGLRRVMSIDKTDPRTFFGADSADVAGGVLEAERMMTLFVANGVTTIRNMRGSPHVVALKQRIARGELLGPRIYTSTPSVYSEYSPAEAVRIVEGAKAAGYDLVKMYNDGEAWDSTVAAAHRVGMPIAGHVGMGVLKDSTGAPLNLDDGTDEGWLRWAKATAKASIHAGYRSIEHLDNAGRLWIEGAKGDPDVKQLVAEMRHDKVWFTPTLGFVGVTPPLSLLPDSEAHERRYYIRDSTGQLPPLERDQKLVQWKEARKDLEQSFRQAITFLRDAGVGLLLGTDISMTAPGFSVHRELEGFVQLGLTPYEALATGTRNVAEYFGALDSTGTVAIGKRADLVLLEGNPLQDIRQTWCQVGVMVAGRWLARADLDSLTKPLEGTLECAGMFSSC